MSASVGPLFLPTVPAYKEVLRRGRSGLRSHRSPRVRWRPGLIDWVFGSGGEEAALARRVGRLAEEVGVAPASLRSHYYGGSGARSRSSPSAAAFERVIPQSPSESYWRSRLRAQSLLPCVKEVVPKARSK